MRLLICQRAGPVSLALACALVLSAFLGVLWVGGLAAPSTSDWAAIRFTVVQAALSACFSVLLAFPVARALSRNAFIGRNLLVTLLGAPFILPVIVAVFGLLAVFGRSGWVSQGLSAFGLPPLSIYGLDGVVLAHVFFNLPLVTRIFLQGLSDVPAERFRLAGQLGMTSRDLFRLVEWPMLKRLAPGAFALVFTICLTSFAVALTLGGGPRATTIELAIYQAFRFDFDLGRAASLSILQVGLAGSAALIALWLLPSSVAEGGMLRRQKRWDRSSWDALWIVSAAGFLLIPISAVIFSGLNGLSEMPISVWRAAGTSLWVALVSVLLMLCLALPMACWLASTEKGRLEAFGLFGLAASPLMIGTGWFILLNPIADPRALALPVTALVNALMTLPFALRVLVPAIREALLDHVRLCVNLGFGPWEIWRWAILPRLWPRLGFVAGLGAALSIGDLGVVALFGDPERATLPLQMYRLMGSYQSEAAAGASLLLVVLAFGLFWAFDQGGRRLART